MSGVSVCARICKCVYKLGREGEGLGSVLHSTTADIKRDFFETFLFVCLFAVKIAFAVVGERVVGEQTRTRCEKDRTAALTNEVRHLSQVDVRHSVWARCGWSIWIALNFLRAHVHGGRKRTVRCNKQQLE